MVVMKVASAWSLQAQLRGSGLALYLLALELLEHMAGVRRPFVL